MSQSGDTPQPGFADDSPDDPASDPTQSPTTASDPMQSPFTAWANVPANAPANGPADGLDPFQLELAQFVDRAVHFEKIIAWAQASKAEVLADAWNFVSSTAETGRPQPGPGHEHDWDATFAAQQGLIAEMACALRIPSGTASGLMQESHALVESRPRTLAALRSLGAGISAIVNVTVPVLTLMGTSEEPGELEGYGPIDPETARRLAASPAPPQASCACSPTRTPVSCSASATQHSGYQRR